MTRYLRSDSGRNRASGTDIIICDKWDRYGIMFCPMAVVNILVVIFWVILVVVFRVTTVVTMLINLMNLGN